jgi:hypothetical protein
MFNLILGIIICIIIMKYNQEIVSFLISSDSINLTINYLKSLKEPK